jgi:recombination associated protein RdgC
MWFKNLQIYRLPAPWAFTADQLATALLPQMFVPASSNELLRQGWDRPRGADGALVHVVGGQFLLQLVTEKKILPAKAVKQRAEAMASELEEQQGFRPGKKAMKELRERAADELLPRALSVRSHLNVWIDPKNGWLVVDTASPTKADDVIKLLLKAVDRMPLESLRVQRSPVAMMTAWLKQELSALDYNFTIDQDATLRATGEGKAQVGFKNHSLDPEDIWQHLSSGKQCTRLAMTWNSRISFVLTESLAIRSIRPLDVIKENEVAAASNDERFDNDFALMTLEYARMLADLVEALGGEAKA